MKKSEKDRLESLMQSRRDSADQCLIKVPLAANVKVGDWVWDGMTEGAAQIVKVAKVGDKIRVSARRYEDPEYPLPLVYDQDYVPDQCGDWVMWYPHSGDAWFFCPPCVPDFGLLLDRGRYYVFFDGEMVRVFDTFDEATVWLRASPVTS